MSNVRNCIFSKYRTFSTLTTLCNSFSICPQSKTYSASFHRLICLSFDNLLNYCIQDFARFVKFAVSLP
jgi:hypothetical protein